MGFRQALEFFTGAAISAGRAYADALLEIEEAQTIREERIARRNAQQKAIALQEATVTLEFLKHNQNVMEWQQAPIREAQKQEDEFDLFTRKEDDRAETQKDIDTARITKQAEEDRETARVADERKTTADAKALEATTNAINKLAITDKLKGYLIADAHGSDAAGLLAGKQLDFENEAHLKSVLRTLIDNSKTMTPEEKEQAHLSVNGLTIAGQMMAGDQAMEREQHRTDNPPGKEPKKTLAEKKQEIDDEIALAQYKRDLYAKMDQLDPGSREELNKIITAIESDTIIRDLSKAGRAIASAKAAAEQYRNNLGSGVAEIAMLYSFIKMIDVGSVVRSEEINLFRQARSVWDRVKETFKKVKEGTALTETELEQIVGMANEMAEAYDAAYQKVRKKYVVRFEGMGALNITNPETGEVINMTNPDIYLMPASFEDAVIPSVTEQDLKDAINNTEQNMDQQQGKSSSPTTGDLKPQTPTGTIDTPQTPTGSKPTYTDALIQNFATGTPEGQDEETTRKKLTAALEGHPKYKDHPDIIKEIVQKVIERLY